MVIHFKTTVSQAKFLSIHLWHQSPHLTMALPNIFEKEVTVTIISRIEKLSPETPALWGKMDVAQMLAHCNVSYDLIYTNKYPKPGFLMKLILKAFVKDKVVNEKTYTKNLATGPQFRIADSRRFEEEKQKLIDNLIKTQSFGSQWFDGKESHSFGRLTATEWNNMLYKHLDHHLRQFGA